MKKKYYILLGILALFIVTNPSISAFKAYIGSSTYSGLKRTTNLFVCGLYKHNGETYFGMIGNFWKFNESRIRITTQTSNDSVKIADSTIMADSSKSNHYSVSGYTSDGLPILRKK